MRTFKNWLITVLLKKDKLVAVPEKWQVDYVKTASNNVKNTQAIIFHDSFAYLAKELGIETLPPEQLNAMKESWGICTKEQKQQV